MDNCRGLVLTLMYCSCFGIECTIYIAIFRCLCANVFLLIFFYFSVEYISWGNPPGTSPHFEDGTYAKLDSLQIKGNTTIYSLRAQHVTCRNLS